MQIKMTRDQFNARAAQLGHLGIEVKCDTGAISHSGVTLNYAFNGTTLDVEIAHKPFYVTTKYVEDQITSWFASA